jgi:hypothetical protein
MLRRVALVRTDFSEENRASNIRVRRLEVMANVVPRSQFLVTLMMEAVNFSETLVLVRATRRDIPEDGIQRGGSPTVDNLSCLYRSRYFFSFK